MEVRSYNYFSLVGTIGSDPELKETEGGKEYCRFSLLTIESVKQGDEYKEVNTWHNLTAWGRLVKFVSQYIGKGDIVSITGKIGKRQIDKLWVPSLMVNTVTFIKKKSKPKTEEPTEEEPYTSGNATQPEETPEPQEEEENVPF